MFIYVFSERDKISLLSAGYEMLKADNFGGVFVFLVGNSPNVKEFEKLDRYVLSSVLSF